MEPTLSQMPSSEGMARGRPIQFARRGVVLEDCFVGEDFQMQPYDALAAAEAAGLNGQLVAALGAAGRHPTSVKDRAHGLWRGTLHSRAGNPEKDVAAQVAPYLAGTVTLDGCGIMGDIDVETSALRFIPAAGNSTEAESCHDVGEAVHAALAKAAAVALGGKPAATFRLAGRLGQILSHDGLFWVRPTGDDAFDALLWLQPFHRPPGSRMKFTLSRFGPLGAGTETWSELPSVEMPRMARLTMANAQGGVMPARAGGKYLVEEEEETLVVHAWRRDPDVSAVPRAGGDAAPIRVEQLLWYDTVAALDMASVCEDAAVPMARLRIEDEGTATYEEVAAPEGERPDEALQGQEAARFGSLMFFKQCIDDAVLREEVLPLLFPNGGGCARVLSADLAPPESEERSAVAVDVSRQNSKRMPKSIDDLFSDDADFRVPVRWKSASWEKERDPLAHHKLTSVFLVNEQAGFLLAFHCLEMLDPCAVE